MRGLLVRRTASDGTVRVVFPYAWVFYWMVWPTLALTYFASDSGNVSAGVLAVALWGAWIVQAVVMRPAIAELRARMRAGGLRTSGSKYSPSNPLTYEWEAEVGRDGNPNESHATSEAFRLDAR